MAEKFSRLVPIFSLTSPQSYRYKVKELTPYLSEQAFVDYKSRAEGALATTQASMGLISKEDAEEISKAALEVSAEDVYEEEEKIGHDVLAQKNQTVRRVSDRAKPAVHRPATAYDKVDTANAARYKDAFQKVIIPDMASLVRGWISTARKEKDTVQIGRTHLQHAEPITYGFATAWYLSRFGKRMEKLIGAADELEGKFSGSTGAYNASSLFFDDPESFEEEILAEMGLEPSEISTQIAQPEPVLDLIHYTVSAFGVLANWADDMRNLMRPELDEVDQPRKGSGVDISTSSIMPHKKNPVGVENVKSAWKAAMPRIFTYYMDQISDHQRDLTNSASSRYVAEIFELFDYSVRRAARIVPKLLTRPDKMKRNLQLSAGMIIAEPLQILLSAYGHTDAHHHVETLRDKAYETGKTISELVLNDSALKPYLDKFTEKQKAILMDPTAYTGIAAKKAAKVADAWDVRLKGMGF